RRIEPNPVVKSRPAFGLICTWLIPGREYSTGSSKVITLQALESIACNIAYRVVVLPDPVAPVARTIPWDRRDKDPSRCTLAGARPSGSRPVIRGLWSSTRRAAFSPKDVGNVDIRKSPSRESIFI